MDRLRRGEEIAFEELAHDNVPAMLAAARRVLRSDQDAWDVVQDAFGQALRGLPEFEGRARLSTWLHRITINAALMQLRRQRRRPETPSEDVHRLADRGNPRNEFESETPSWARPPNAQLESREGWARVNDCLESLPEAHREVVVLRAVEGLDTGEVARELGISEEAVRMRLYRARRALRSALASR